MTEEPLAEAADFIAALRDGQSNAAVQGALKQRVQSRLAVSLIGLTPTLAGTSPAPNAASSSGLAAAHGAGISKGVLIAWLAPVFVLGALTGVGIDRWQLRQAARRAQLAAVTSPPPAAPADPQPKPVNAPFGVGAPNANEIISTEALELVPPTQSSSAPSASALDAASSLAAERHLLDDARQALARGEPQAGMVPLGQHAKRFPHGLLAEEREALAVRLLAALGNRPAAIERAERFRQRFPNSLFTPAVNNAVAQFSRRSGAGEPKP